MKRFLVSLAPFLAILSLWAYAYENQDRFPNPVAIHWGISGEPDGFADLQTHLLATTFALGIPAILWLVVVQMRKIPFVIRRLFLAIVGYLFVVLYFLMLRTFSIQLDLQDASSAQLGLEMLLWLIPFFALVPWLLTMPKVELSELVTVRYWGIPLLRIDFGEIVKVSTVFAKGSEFGGYGIRYSRGTTALLPSKGQALLLELVSGGRILIRSNQAPELAKQIELRMKH